MQTCLDQCSSRVHRTCHPVIQRSVGLERDECRCGYSAVLSGNRCCRATVKRSPKRLVDGPSILGFEGIRELVLGDL
jgi:hypothetical protein